jgi:hypothetical protein
MSEPEGAKPVNISAAMGGSSSVRATLTLSRSLTTESLIFGVALGIVGTVIWQFKHIRGIGDGVLATAVFVLLAVGLKRLQQWMQASPYPICHSILRLVRLEL